MELSAMELLQRRIDSPERALAELKQRMTLTQRQEEVLCRKRAGESYKEIGEKLGITGPAVRTHYFVAEKKAAELERELDCPHCSGKIRIYDII